MGETRGVRRQTSRRGEEAEQRALESVKKLAQEVYSGLDFEYNKNIETTLEETMSVTKKEELQLIKAANSGRSSVAEQAKVELLDKYERLCHKLARKFAFTAPSHVHEDLVQEGRIGLLQAIATYDENAGASFMTWAYYHVRGAIAGCGRVDSKQPRFPRSIEDDERAYNIEDPTQDIAIRDDLSTDLIKRLLTDCCGGLTTKRANIVMDRFGLLGRKELRNFECARKYGLTKYAVNSHVYNFKKKAKAKYPELANFV